MPIKKLIEIDIEKYKKKLIRNIFNIILIKYPYIYLILYKKPYILLQTS